VVKANAADQSFLIESIYSHNRFWVYADNTLFGELDHVLLSSQFYGGKAADITGDFYIQGRVLVQFDLGYDMHEMTDVLCAAFTKVLADRKKAPSK
jgi:hypothetical protein